MKITVLGYWGAYPGQGEATAGYLLETDKHHILIDCGSGVLAQLFKYISIDALDAVFLSHYHHDHVADLGCLQYAVMIGQQLENTPDARSSAAKSSAANISASKSSSAKSSSAAQALPIYGHQQSPFIPNLSFKNLTAGQEIKAGVPLDLNGLKVEFMQTVHEEYNLAMRFEYGGKRLVYTGDTGYSEDLISFMAGADLVIAESSLYAYQRKQGNGHLTSVEAGELSAKANIQELVLTHFPHYGDLTSLQTEAQHVFKGKVQMAATGKTFEI
ncbi:MBL fold metallo-hydrolase [Desulfitobacterium sp. Sab5]|uniref:MBL fold metallo-hydrolase n=1 Tax=Desulfitobacterium nosdiversum TaxID=3375356 RepID=UPI003CEA8505